MGKTKQEQFMKSLEGLDKASFIIKPITNKSIEVDINGDATQISFLFAEGLSMMSDQDKESTDLLVQAIEIGIRAYKEDFRNNEKTSN